MPRISIVIATLLVAAALLGGAGRAVAQEPGPAASPEAVPTIVAAYVEALNAHDPDRVAALYAEDAVVEQAVSGGHVFHGRAEIGAWVGDNLAGVPDLVVSTDAVIAAGDRIAWAWVYRGAYTGQYPRLPRGHGQPIELRGVSLFDLRDGRIAHEAVYFDNATFLAEADAPGATPDAGAAS
jgi:steroid delta-isomerase-like uncharacterized protein